MMLGARKEDAAPQVAQSDAPDKPKQKRPTSYSRDGMILTSLLGDR
jgi:hypothetical protein